MIVGITGTREGMTPVQNIRLSAELRKIAHIDEFHHGGCVGADMEAEGIVRQWHGVSVKEIVEHPGQPGTYFKRNREIVDAVDVLYVCPRLNEREDRGGTWYTHDYAVKRGKSVKIVWPNGSVTETCAGQWINPGGL